MPVCNSTESANWKIGTHYFSPFATPQKVIILVSDNEEGILAEDLTG